jgi:hypothetical protein
MSHGSNPLKKGLLVLYVGMWSILITAAGAWLTVFLVGTLRDPLADKDVPAEQEVFDSVLALTEKKVVRYLGEWEFLEPKLPGHFHHVGRWYQSDTWNFCITCHGQTPHSRSPQVRAFLNMHNLFISCQTCHVRENEAAPPTRFGWADITDGQLCSSPDMAAHPWGEYGTKIVPLTGPAENPRPVTLEEEEAFAAQSLKRMDKLSDQQKVIANRFIHRRCVETPVSCTSCHGAKPFLPYTALGYSSERANFLMSTEVAELVARYETFHMPTLLKTDEPPKEGTGEDVK